jgi:hypothetical protein
MIVYLFRRLGPFKWQVYDLTWGLNAFQRLHDGLQNRHLPGRVAGLPKCAPQRVFNGSQARHAYRSSQIRHGRQGDGAEAGGFDFALYQSNGPAAYRSGRHQHDHVHQVFFQIPDDGWDGLLQQHLRIEYIAHDRVMPGAYAPYPTAGFQFL